jgi:hypothetical protein
VGKDSRSESEYDEISDDEAEYYEKNDETTEPEESP